MRLAESLPHPVAELAIGEAVLELGVTARVPTGAAEVDLTAVDLAVLGDAAMELAALEREARLASGGRASRGRW